jgi:hypothetical protein
LFKRVGPALLEATGRRETPAKGKKLESGNVVYQGRILLSVISLVPAVLWHLKRTGQPLISAKSEEKLTKWFRGLIENADLISRGRFIDKEEFKRGGYLGSGGIARFRDRLWASVLGAERTSSRMQPDKLAVLAEQNKRKISSKSGRA